MHRQLSNPEIQIQELPDILFEGMNSLIYYSASQQDGTTAEPHGNMVSYGASPLQSSNHLITSSSAHPYIMKVLREEEPTPQQIVQFKNEYEFTKDISSKGIRRAYNYTKIDGQHVLLLEYVPGDPIRNVFANRGHQWFDFLEIAIRIAETLSDIHRQNIVHKDINGNNILLDEENEKVTLIDFGISSRLDSKMESQGNPELLEGTLPYISPEQTGRMNRVVDYRSDLYSLGVTFYELLAGRLPFITNDTLELIHCHIAKQPIPISEVVPEVPSILSDIVMKLMAKNAEDRYQSALGLAADLTECLRQWKETGDIQPFVLGREDFSGKFQIPQKLYGRERPIQQLNASFARVSAGNSELMLVAGYSGIGKSALVQELYKPITEKKGYFIGGKFDQFQRNIPYAGVVKAFQELVRQLLTESEAQLDSWRKRLAKAFGPNGQVIVDVIPEIALIVGPQPPVHDLGPMEAQNRFNLVFQNFVRVFCQPEHPLILFLDDLQWADSASLKLIELIMTDEETKYLFLIGSYRDNEVMGQGDEEKDTGKPSPSTPTHPLLLSLERLEDAGTTIHQINLTPLSLDHVAALIAETLHQDHASVLPLTELVMGKTDGNPFFVNEFLKNLYQEDLLVFDVEERHWQWNIAKIEALEITDNVVDLMIGKLRKLSPAVQQVLRLAACVGNRFELGTIAMVCQQSLADTFDHLTTAIQEGLVLPLSGLEIHEQHDEDIAATQHGGERANGDGTTTQPSSHLFIRHYKFAHDRVQQAAYALVDDAQKQERHLQIGRLLLKKWQTEKVGNGRDDTQRKVSSDPVITSSLSAVSQLTAKQIFELADHLNLGAALIEDESERITLSELNLLAGRRAKAAMAYEPALAYLQAGLGLLQVDEQGGQSGSVEQADHPNMSVSHPVVSWDRHYDLTLAHSLEMVEVEYLNANVVGATQLADDILQHAKELLEKVKVYEFQIQFYVFQNQPQTAIERAVEALQLLGIMLPIDEEEAFVYSQARYQELQTAIQQIPDLVNLPVTTDSHHLATLRVLMAAISAAFQTNPKLMPAIVFTMVQLCLKKGNSPLAAYAYGMFGMLMCAFYQDLDTGYRFGRLAQQILNQFDAIELQAKFACLFNICIQHWKEHVRNTIEPLQTAVQIGIENGDVEYAFHNASQVGFHLFFMGERLETVLQKQAQYLEWMETFKSEFHTNQIYIREQMIRNLLGGKNANSSDPCLLVGERINEPQMMPIWIDQGQNLLIFLANNTKTILSYLFGQYAEAIAAAEVAAQFEFGMTSNICIPEVTFYHTLALLAHAPSVDEPTRQKYLTQAMINQERMAHWAAHAPSNFQHKLDLIMAEQAAITEEPLTAMRLYDQAINRAREEGFIQEEAIAYERAAIFYKALGHTEIAQTYMNKAHYGYQMWGAKAKVEQLERQHPMLLSRLRNQPNRPESSADYTRFSHNSTTNPMTNSGLAESLDLTTVMKASQAISGEIALEKLLSQLIRIVIENAGAQNGTLILERQGQLRIEAQGTIEDDDVEVLHSLPLEMARGGTQSTSASPHRVVPLCTAVVNLVFRTQNPIVLHNATQSSEFARDPYIIQHQPKSILCMPLVNQGRVSGILYLENNLSTNAFTPNRLTILNLLSSQMAISLDNAILYGEIQRHRDHLEELVDERTKELSETLDHLNATQEQLVESEKMAALGGLVAGVAHEINTPIGIGVMAASTLGDELKSITAAYKSNKLKRSAWESYLNMAQQSSQLLLNNLQRAAELVQSFKQVAVDQTSLERRTFEVKTYIEGALLSLKPKLNCTAHRLQVDGEANLSLYSYPGALSQVITNLVMNSLNHAYGEDEAGLLHVQMTRYENQLCIEYTDDGCGIPTANLKRVFEPFFTTARNQGGTGLGLHIVYNLVTQKLGGTIRCESTVGIGTKFIIDLPLTVESKVIG